MFKSITHCVQRLREIDKELATRKANLKKKNSNSSKVKTSNNLTSQCQSYVVKSESDIDRIAKIAKQEYLKNGISQTAINYQKINGTVTALSSYCLESNHYSNDYKKRQLDKLNSNKIKAKVKKQLPVITNCKESIKDLSSSDLIDNLNLINQVSNNSKPSQDNSINESKPLLYSYLHDRRIILNNRKKASKNSQDNLKKYINDKLKELLKEYNCQSINELKAIRGDYPALDNELLYLEFDIEDHKHLKQVTRLDKKAVKNTYKNGLLEFTNDKELDLDYELDGLDNLVKYFLLKRPAYNYKSFCETYEIEIDDLRNEANLVILQNKKSIIEKIKEYNCQFYSQLELGSDDRKEVTNFIFNIIRKKVDLYCQTVSNNVTIPVDAFKNENKRTATINNLRKARQLNSNQNVNKTIDKRLTNSRQDKKRSLLTVNDNNIKQLDLIDNNGKIEKSSYYKKIIEPLNNNIIVREACLSEAPKYRIDLEGASLIVSKYKYLSKSIIEKMSIKSIALHFKKDSKKIKELIELDRQACIQEVNVYLQYLNNLKEFKDNKLTSSNIEKLINMIY